MNKKGEDKSLKSEVALKEEKILDFWNKSEIFKKTLEKKAPAGNFVFYEGPPTANAKPALHHLESRVFKDIIPRYKTMRGFYVRRKAGWDTHGLPVELQIEKKLGLKSKKEIEQYGVEKFNKECKDSVFQYISDWESFTERIGYWVDKKDAYYTFDTNYIESVWNILKTVNDKKLLYKDYKVLPWCPRCGTALSSHELAQGYQDDKDLSVTAKFKVVESDETFSRVLGKNPQTARKSSTGSTYILAWTTTPWTLPGNVGLAVGEDIEYVKIKTGDDILILAKERLSIVSEKYEIIGEVKGKNLVGLKYEPLYPFMKAKFEEKDSEAFKKAYQVYPADFVTTTDGTGVVHTAVMYGQEDFELGTKIGLPKFHLVKEDGNFLGDMDFLSGRFVKDEEVAVDIIKDLAHRGLLFKKEKYEHSYPHCWRCNTPLIYYARDSWYIAMSKLRGELVKENEDIHWEPEHIKEGRFGEWLREIKDWAISRERYWGTPLPIWQDKEGKVYVLGSVEELKRQTKKSGNKYFTVRHAESEKNTKGVINADLKNIFHLTEKGKEQAKDSAKKLKSEKIDLIISSPFHRCKETADIIREQIGLKEEVLVDDRLWEIKSGTDYEGKVDGANLAFFEKYDDRFYKAPPGGETFSELKKRAGHFLYEIEKKYENKNILIVTHMAPISFMKNVCRGGGKEELLKIRKEEEPLCGYAEFASLDFVPLPHNENYELDLHKPFIDGVELVGEKGETLTRVKEVLDVWFDSGAMPFAQDHFPFEKDKPAYPADFISEAIDQTRGWFYTLHAIGVLMGKGKAFKNVICLGHILDSHGKKMSKSIGNIVDPWMLMDKYGVDALRLWMYTVNSPGDSKNFDEKTVDEIVKKVFNPLINVLAFYELYKDLTTTPSDTSKNILDKWILSKLNKLIREGTNNLDNFKVFESARSIRDFVNDFSTWYVRRSRDRFKSDDVNEKNEALGTTSFVLMELVKYMAPFTPFFSEEIYQKIKSSKNPESVHLCQWPETTDFDKELLDNMEKVREVVSKALELRQKAGLKVRQPLGYLATGTHFPDDLLSIIADEVNVKEVKVGKEIKLDTTLTEELKNEGVARDVIRGIQDVRKTESLSPNDKIKLVIHTSKEIEKILSDFGEMIKAPTQVTEISFSKEEQTHKIALEGHKLSLSIVK